MRRPEDRGLSLDREKRKFCVYSIPSQTFCECKNKLEILKKIIFDYTGSFTSLGIRKTAVVSMFLDLLGSKRLLWVHKIGRKLLLGQKYTQICFRVIMQGDCRRREYQDLVILAQHVVCPKKFSSSCNGFRLPNA